MAFMLWVGNKGVVSSRIVRMDCWIRMGEWRGGLWLMGQIRFLGTESM